MDKLDHFYQIWKKYARCWCSISYNFQPNCRSNMSGLSLEILRYGTTCKESNHGFKSFKFYLGQHFLKLFLLKLQKSQKMTSRNVTWP